MKNQKRNRTFVRLKRTNVERLLHYTWQHRLFAGGQLTTTGGQTVEVINPGVHNHDAGPDFIGGVVRIDGYTLAGNIEIHTKSSDWNRHGHGHDEKYANIVLHVVGEADTEVCDCRGRVLPQLVISVPQYVEHNYSTLLSEEKFPPCWRHVPLIPNIKVSGWLSALHVERLEEKVTRIEQCLERCEHDWERVCFITVARNFGFGVNGEAFEEWAYRIPLSAAGKHRDNIFQVEAMFLGQAGLLDPDAVPSKYRAAADAEGWFGKLSAEYAFLAHKFSLTPMPAEHWKLLRTRPQNFPHIRLSQLAGLFSRGAISLSQLTAPGDLRQVRRRLEATATDYWHSHYLFGCESSKGDKALRIRSLNLLVLNSVIPLMFAYGRYRGEKALEEGALQLFASLPPEDNFITRTWKELGISAASAADSQALIHLKRNYCDRRDCLRCSFGLEYLKVREDPPAPNQ